MREALGRAFVPNRTAAIGATGSVFSRILVGMDRAPFTCQRQGDVFVVGGAIDERAQLMALLRWATGKHMVLDLGGVTFVNSLGVREWVRLQTAAREAGVTLELRRVAEVLVYQLNIVPAARAASTIASFLATYVCEVCGNEQAELLDVARDRALLEAGKAPPAPCQACGMGAQISEPPELYVSFLSGGSALR